MQITQTILKSFDSVGLTLRIYFNICLSGSDAPHFKNADFASVV